MPVHMPMLVSICMPIRSHIRRHIRRYTRMPMHVHTHVHISMIVVWMGTGGTTDGRFLRVVDSAAAKAEASSMGMIDENLRTILVITIHSTLDLRRQKLKYITSRQPLPSRRIL